MIVCKCPKLIRNIKSMILRPVSLLFRHCYKSKSVSLLLNMISHAHHLSMFLLLVYTILISIVENKIKH